MPGKPAQVDVVIVNFNGGPFLLKSVKCLLAQTFSDFTAIIVDNASSDNSLDDLPEDPRLQIMRLSENTGFAHANNVGAAAGRSQWIATLNPDAFAAPDWLENLLHAARQSADIVMAGSAQFADHDPALLDGAGDLYAPFGFAWRGLYQRPAFLLPDTGEVFGPCAAAALYRRDEFEQVGGFDEDFFCYHEDVDLAFRLRLRGGRAIQVREAKVRHVGSGLTGRESPFAVYHGTRNRIWTYCKDMPLAAFWLFLLPHIALSLAFLVRSLFKHRFGPTLRGTLDGLAGLPAVWPKRRMAQTTRTMSLWRLLSIMTWSPVKFLTRDADVRPWRTRQDDR